MTINEDGTKLWKLKGLYHRTDGPAIEWTDGSYFWYMKGLLHRTNGPAVETREYRQWFNKGLRHRTDGPAIMMKNVSIGISDIWFLEGTNLSYNEWLNKVLFNVVKIELYIDK
jgi:hypothetical protein